MFWYQGVFNHKLIFRWDEVTAHNVICDKYEMGGDEKDLFGFFCNTKQVTYEICTVSSMCQNIQMSVDCVYQMHVLEGDGERLLNVCKVALLEVGYSR